MKYSIKAFFAALPLIALLSSCKKEVSPNNDQSGSLQLALQAISPAVSLGSATTSQASFSRENVATITWVSGEASSKMIKFEATRDNKETEFKTTINKTINLFAINDLLGTINLTPGIYNEVEFRLDLTPLNNHPSLEIKGNYTSAGKTTVIHFISNEDITIKGEKSQVTIDAGQSLQAITQLNMTDMVSGINEAILNSAVVTNNEILISSTVNADLYKAIVKNLRNMGREAEIHK